MKYKLEFFWNQNLVSWPLTSKWFWNKKLQYLLLEILVPSLCSRRPKFNSAQEKCARKEISLHNLNRKKTPRSRVIKLFLIKIIELYNKTSTYRVFHKERYKSICLLNRSEGFLWPRTCGNILMWLENLKIRLLKYPKKTFLMKIEVCGKYIRIFKYKLKYKGKSHTFSDLFYFCRNL